MILFYAACSRDNTALKTEHLTKPLRILERSVVAVGSFDGLHLGHRAIVSRLVESANIADIPSVVVTFEPHPRIAMGGEMRLLTTREEKVAAFSALSLDILVTIRFDRAFAETEPGDFVEKYLVSSLGMKKIVVGADHGFGCERSGDSELLKKLGETFSFDVEVVEPVLWNGVPIKSSGIRESIENGDMKSAAQMLGRPYSLFGEIVMGYERGSSLGFPTANIALSSRKLLPPMGVYAATDNAGNIGLLYIGTRPTFGGGDVSAEFHAVEGGEYYYGEETSISIFERIRGESFFEDAMHLVEQMKKDKIYLLQWAERLKTTAIS